MAKKEVAGLAALISLVILGSTFVLLENNTVQESNFIKTNPDFNLTITILNSYNSGNDKLVYDLKVQAIGVTHYIYISDVISISSDLFAKIERDENSYQENINTQMYSLEQQLTLNKQGITTETNFSVQLEFSDPTLPIFLFTNELKKKDTIIFNPDTQTWGLLGKKIVPVKDGRKPNYKLLQDQGIGFQETFDEIQQLRYDEVNNSGSNSTYTGTWEDSLLKIKKDESGYNESAAGGLDIISKKKTLLNRFKLAKLSSFNYTSLVTNDTLDLEGQYQRDSNCNKTYTYSTTSTFYQAYYYGEPAGGNPCGLIDERRGFIAFYFTSEVKNTFINQANLTLISQGSFADFTIVIERWSYTTDPVTENTHNDDSSWFLASLNVITSSAISAAAAGESFVFDVTDYARNFATPSTTTDLIGFRIQTSQKPGDGSEGGSFYDAQSGTAAQLDLEWRESDTIEIIDDSGNITFDEGDVDLPNITITPRIFDNDTDPNNPLPEADYYNLWRNGAIIETGTWADNVPLSVDLESMNLVVGTYNFTWQLFLTDGSFYTYTLWVFVTMPSNLADVAEISYSVHLEPQEVISVSMDWYFKKRANRVTAKYYPDKFFFDLAIGEDYTQPNISSWFRMEMRDDQNGSVYLAWKTTSGNVSYDTGIDLAASGARYKFIIEFKKSIGEIIVSIVNGSGYNILRQLNWQKLSSDPATEFPSLLSDEPVDYDLGASGLKEKQGIILTWGAVSERVPTGEPEYWIDQVYSSSPLVDNGFRTRETIESIIKDYDWLGMSIDYDTTSTIIADIRYNDYLYNFRSITGIMGFKQTERNYSLGLSTMKIQLDVYPVNFAGSTDSGEKITISVSYSRPSIQVQLIDNGSFTRKYYDVASTADPIALEVGFGIYWLPDKAGRKTLAGSVKVWDSKNDELETHSVFLDLPTNYWTNDVKMKITHQASGSNVNEGAEATTRITDSTIVQGANLFFNPDTIPVPTQPYIRPKKNFFDDLFGTFSGITGDFIGNPFGALFGIWDTFEDIWNGFTNLLTDTFNLVGNLVQDFIDDFISPFLDALVAIIISSALTIGNGIRDVLIYPIFDWFLDTFNIREWFDQTVSFTLFLLDISAYVFFLIVFACFSYPLLISRTGEEALQNLVSVWFFDATLGISILGFRIYIPLIFVMLIWSVILGYDHIFIPSIPW